jgi:hypothetical protein
VLDQNFMCTNGTAQGMLMHSPNDMHETCAMGVMMITKDTASVVKDLA